MRFSQSKFLISEFFLSDFKIPNEYMLNDRMLLKQAKDGTAIYILSRAGESENENLQFSKDEKLVARFLQICALASRHSPRIIQRGSNPLESESEFGKDHLFGTLSMSVVYPDEHLPELNSKCDAYVGKIKNILAKYATVFDEASFLRNALYYYYRAKIGPWYQTGQYIDLAISLESLYNEAPSDIAYKIAMRASFLIGLTGLDPTVVFGEVKDLYKIRNEIVHGQMGEPTPEEISKIMRYARRSIVCFCLLSESLRMKKKDLVDLIDEGIINEIKRKEIAEILKDFNDFDLSASLERDKFRVSW